MQCHIIHPHDYAMSPPHNGEPCFRTVGNDATFLRHFFDALVTGHAVALNSFASVRGTKYKVVDGKTAEISIAQAKKLFSSLDTGTIVGLCDGPYWACWHIREPESARWRPCAFPIITI